MGPSVGAAGRAGRSGSIGLRVAGAGQGTEVHVDVRDAVLVELEVLDVAEAVAVDLLGFVPDQGVVAVDGELAQVERT